MMGFYGFNFGENPLYSRLFNRDVLQRGQEAFNQGMSMFTPYDPNKKPEEAPKPTQQASNRPQMGVGSLWLTPDGRVVELGKGFTNFNYTGMGTNPGGATPTTAQLTGQVKERFYNDPEYMKQQGLRPFNFGNFNG